MAYKGKYIPTNPHKYIGNHRNVVYRSLWNGGSWYTVTQLIKL